MYTSGNMETFLRDMQEGVRDYTDDGECSRCGSCCTSLLYMTKKEIKDMASYVRKNHIEIQPVHEGYELDLSCPFRDDVRKICTVYERRPFICRNFKCNKCRKDIEEAKAGLEADSRYRSVNLRSIFKA